MLISFRAVVGVLVGLVLAVGAGDALGQVFRESMRVDWITENQNDADLGEYIKWSGDRVVVSARLATVNDRTNVGRVLVFDSVTGDLLFELDPPEVRRNMLFGYSMDVADGLIVVGAIFDNPGGLESGSAYLYDATDGSFLFELTPSTHFQNDWFGFESAVGDGVVAVAKRFRTGVNNSTGRIHVFDVATGNELYWVDPPTPLPNTGSGLIAYPQIEDGKLYTWYSPFIPHPNGEYDRMYVYDALTGAPLPDVELPFVDMDGIAKFPNIEDGKLIQVDSGAVHLFNIDELEPIATLVGESINPSSAASVSVDGSVVAVGDPGNNMTGSGSGLVSIFDLSEGTEQIGWASIEGANAGDWIGYRVAVRGRKVAFGAHRLQAPTGNDGTWFNGVLSVADLDQDRCIAERLPSFYELNFFDVSTYVQQYNSSDPRADLAEPFGVFNFFDISAYITEFAAGCP